MVVPEPRTALSDSRPLPSSPRSSWPISPSSRAATRLACARTHPSSSFPTPPPPTGWAGSLVASPATATDGDGRRPIGSDGRKAPVLLRRPDARKPPRPGRHRGPHYTLADRPASSEDLNLAALLGWIDPPAGMDGPQAARADEESPPAGPDPDLNWDAKILAELIQDWHAADDEASRSAVRRDLLSMRSVSSYFQRGHGAGGRWIASAPCRLPTTSPADGSWTAAAGPATATGSPRAGRTSATSPRRSRARPGCRILEARTEDLQREMAWDDPLVMAAVVASGEALAGRVVAADPDRRTRNANGNTVRRPLITIEPALEFARPAGTTLFLSTSPGVKLEVLPSDASGLIRAEVLKGANQNTTIGLLPKLGRRGGPQPLRKARVLPAVEGRGHPLDAPADPRRRPRGGSR